MKLIRWFQLILMLVLLAACAPTSVNGTPQAGFSLFPTNTPLPTASIQITHAPDATSAMTVFLNALKNNDFASMYSMLSKASQAAITQDAFTKEYNDAMDALSATTLDYEIHSQTLNPDKAQVAFGVTYHTALFGDIKRNINVNLVLEGSNGWRIVWDDGLILPELAGGGKHLSIDYQIPSRGDIYDRNGAPLVQQSDAYAFGVIPGQLSDKSRGTLVSELSMLCGRTQDDINSAINAAAPDWYVAMCEASPTEVQGVLNLGLGGLSYTQYNSRYYLDQGLAPQVIGYTQLIPKEEFDTYRRLGYRGDETVGTAGIEKSMEQYLAGKHGGSLYVIDANGQPVANIAAVPPTPPSSVYLTIDKNLQYYTQQALQGFKGSAVVIERDTGRILAMASSPTYDPNLFDANNPNNQYLLNNLLQSTDKPLLNRASQGELPLGSVFKVITFSAALESGLYIPQTQYDCQYDFTELTNVVLHDWTWEHCQARLQSGKQCDTSDSKPSGLLTLDQGLMRSCNPYFWHIGRDLFINNRPADIANMAKAFGLDAATGIQVIPEATGNIAVPASELDATNQAIGQGDVLVTPLQVARLIAAIGNGGTLYRPQLIEKVQSVDGTSQNVFKPEAAGTLPLRPDNLKALQDAMVSVVNNPLGTAYYRLRGLNIPVAGKTGTAQSGSDLPHAWFAGYTMDEQNSNLPDIAVVVVLENQGEGSDWAAPIFRWIVETYYYGSPQSVPWFGPIGNPYTPTPLGGIPTRTPRPGKAQPTPTP